MFCGGFIDAFRHGLTAFLFWHRLFCLLTLQLRQLCLQHSQLRFEQFLLLLLFFRCGITHGDFFKLLSDFRYLFGQTGDLEAMSFPPELLSTLPISIADRETGLRVVILRSFSP